MRFKRIVVLMLLTLLIVVPASAQDDALIKAAQAEGDLDFYANMTTIEPALVPFADHYGIEAKYTRISTDSFAATVLTEHQAGKLRASVLQGPVPLLEMLDDFGILASYKSPVAADYPDWSTDPDGKFQIFAIEYVAPIYNTDLVAAEDAPKSYMDLTDPKWKGGKIVMADPTSHTTTIQWLVGLKEHDIFGSEDAWWEFIRGLAANEPMYVVSFGPCTGPVASGEALISIAMPKDIVTFSPAPLDWARVEPIFGTPRGIALAANAPKPNAGKLFIDYWLTDEAVSILAKEVGEYVLAPGIFPDIGGIENATVIPLRTMSDEEIEYWGDQFARIFR